MLSIPAATFETLSSTNSTIDGFCITTISLSSWNTVYNFDSGLQNIVILALSKLLYLSGVSEIRVIKSSVVNSSLIVQYRVRPCDLRF